MTFAHEVVFAPCHCYSVFLTIIAIHLLLEVIAFDKKLRISAWVDAVSGIACAVVVIVEHVNLSHTSHRHTSLTVLAPFIESIGNIQVASLLVVIGSHEVSVLVHV